MNNKLKDDNIDFLFRAILELETVEDCYDFFEDLCTVQELKTISQRIVVAKMLLYRYSQCYWCVNRYNQPC